jgi:hypothetical protein
MAKTVAQRKADILIALSTSISNFTYYDRKECEDLPLGEIEEAIEKGEITIDELTQAFKSKLITALGQ